jgi:hypothetical protein
MVIVSGVNALKKADSLLDADLRAVAGIPGQLGDIRVGLRHVAGLQGRVALLGLSACSC